MHPRIFSILVLVMIVVSIVDGAKTICNCTTVPTTTNRGINHKRALKDEDMNCDTKNNEKIDMKMAKIMVIGEYGRKYPEDRKQLKAFCDDSTQILNYMEAYKGKCFRGTLRHFSGIFIYSNRNSIRRFCSKGNKQIPGLLKAAKCVNKHMKKLSLCMTRMTENYMGIKYADDKKKVPFICCEYVNIMQCFETEMRNTECKAETDTMLDFLRSVTGNFIDSTCSDYTEESDACAKLGKPPKRKATEKVPKSILYPLYDIINSLPQ